MTWLLLLGAILSEVASTMFLRASDGLRERVWVVPIVVGYVLSFVLLSLVLEHGMALGVAYGVWAATGIALTAVLGRVIFHELLSRVMVVGIVLVAAGVLVVELGAQAAGT